MPLLFVRSLWPQRTMCVSLCLSQNVECSAMYSCTAIYCICTTWHILRARMHACISVTRLPACLPASGCRCRRKIHPIERTCISGLCSACWLGGGATALFLHNMTPRGDKSHRVLCYNHSTMPWPAFVQQYCKVYTKVLLWACGHVLACLN